MHIKQYAKSESFTKLSVQITQAIDQKQAIMMCANTIHLKINQRSTCRAYYNENRRGRQLQIYDS